MAKAKPTKMLAILGRCRRAGRWRVGGRVGVLTLLGRCHLDMSKAIIDDGRLRMNVTVAFGAATFIVPDGAEVRPSGMCFLASSTVDVPAGDVRTDIPPIEIEWTCLFGRLRIHTAAIEAARLLGEDLIEVDGDLDEPTAIAASGGDGASETGASGTEVDAELSGEGAAAARDAGDGSDAVGDDDDIAAGDEPSIGDPATDDPSTDDPSIDDEDGVVIGIGFGDQPIGADARDDEVVQGGADDDDGGAGEDEMIGAPALLDDEPGDAADEEAELSDGVIDDAPRTADGDAGDDSDADELDAERRADDVVEAVAAPQ